MATRNGTATTSTRVSFQLEANATTNATRILENAKATSPSCVPPAWKHIKQFNTTFTRHGRKSTYKLYIINRRSRLRLHIIISLTASYNMVFSSAKVVHKSKTTRRHIYTIVDEVEFYPNLSPLWLSWHLQIAVMSAHRLCSLADRTIPSPAEASARRRHCAGAWWGFLQRRQTSRARTHVGYIIIIIIMAGMEVWLTWLATSWRRGADGLYLSLLQGVLIG